MKRAAIYVRVSTDEQAQQGFSIESQKERLTAFVFSQSWGKCEAYIDDGYTGTNMERPALKRLIRHIQQGKVSAVVVYKLDRLSRRQKDILYLLEDVFLANDVIFKSATEPLDTSTPLGRAMIGILAVFAQLERDTIVERSLDGQRQRKKKGLWSGRAPFGYRWNNETKRLEVVASEARLVQEVFKRFLKGTPRLHIANWLAEQTNSRYVDHTFIFDMLSRPTYIGKLQDNDALIDGLHESIIDMDTWNAAQRRLGKTRKYGRYLLSNILKCSECGGPMKHQKWTRKNRPGYEYDYYICTTYQAKGKKACPTSRSHSQPDIDNKVIEQIKALSTNAEDIKKLSQLNTSQDDLLDELSELEAKLQEVNERSKRLMAALEGGLFDVDSIRERDAELKKEQSMLERRIDEIQGAYKETDIEAFASNVKLIADNWDYMTFDEQFMIVRACVLEVTLHPDKTIDITWNV